MDVSFVKNDIFQCQLRQYVFLLHDDFETKSKHPSSVLFFLLVFLGLTFTCVSVRSNEAENSARSAMVKYCLSRNLFSKANNCEVVNGVRGLRFCLCLRNEQALALILGSSLFPKCKMYVYVQRRSRFLRALSMI